MGELRDATPVSGHLCRQAGRQPAYGPVYDLAKFGQAHTQLPLWGTTGGAQVVPGPHWKGFVGLLWERDKSPFSCHRSLKRQAAAIEEDSELSRLSENPEKGQVQEALRQLSVTCNQLSQKTPPPRSDLRDRIPPGGTGVKCLGGTSQLWQERANNTD